MTIFVHCFLPSIFIHAKNGISHCVFIVLNVFHLLLMLAHQIIDVFFTHRKTWFSSDNKVIEGNEKSTVAFAVINLRNARNSLFKVFQNHFFLSLTSVFVWANIKWGNEMNSASLNQFIRPLHLANCKQKKQYQTKGNMKMNTFVLNCSDVSFEVIKLN